MQANLARRLRPRTIDEIIGQRHLVGEGKIIRRMVETKLLSSMILYGPPGIGKTSIASAIAGTADMAFRTFNATSDKKTKLQEIAAEAQFSGQLVLLLDEIHRLDKPKQDFLLPLLENGEIILIGATTENPYFEVNSPLLSRMRVLRLEALTRDEIILILRRALTDEQRGLGRFSVEAADEVLGILSDRAGGDARVALNLLEQMVLLLRGDAEKSGEPAVLTREVVETVAVQKLQSYDKKGDNHYDVASAFIKSMRGSDPDAAMHYLARMIEGGEDPRFIARRIVICAAEDVGNADPVALMLAVSAMQAAHMVGWPEARIPLAQAVTYIAAAPKSNAAYLAIDRAMADVRDRDCGRVPANLRDSHYRGAELLGHGAGYLYPHDYPEGYVSQQYLPDELAGASYYQPTEHGRERDIRARMALRRKPPDQNK